MAPVIGLTVVKRCTYRGNTDEEWSNKYFFTGAPPASSTEWDTLVTAFAFEEAKLYPATTHIVRFIGYNDDDVHAQSVYTNDLTLTSSEHPGTFTAIAGMQLAGDQAAMIEWRTARKSSRGKWIYLRKYIHNGFNDSVTPDLLAPSYHGVCQTFATNLMEGFWRPGSILRSQKQVEDLELAVASNYVTTRTLKRRGKKKQT